MDTFRRQSVCKHQHQGQQPCCFSAASCSYSLSSICKDCSMLSQLRQRQHMQSSPAYLEVVFGFALLQHLQCELNFKWKTSLVCPPLIENCVVSSGDTTFDLTILSQSKESWKFVDSDGSRWDWLTDMSICNLCCCSVWFTWVWAGGSVAECVCMHACKCFDKCVHMCMCVCVCVCVWVCADISFLDLISNQAYEQKTTATAAATSTVAT